MKTVNQNAFQTVLILRQIFSALLTGAATLAQTRSIIVAEKADILPTLLSGIAFAPYRPEWDNPIFLIGVEMSERNNGERV